MRIKNFRQLFFAKQYRPAPQWIRYQIFFQNFDRRSRTILGRTSSPCNENVHWAS